MYDKKTKPLRACVPVDPFENAPSGGRKDGDGYGEGREGWRGGGEGRRGGEEGEGKEEEGGAQARREG